MNLRAAICWAFLPIAFMVTTLWGWSIFGSVPWFVPAFLTGFALCFFIALWNVAGPSGR